MPGGVDAIERDVQNRRAVALHQRIDPAREHPRRPHARSAGANRQVAAVGIAVNRVMAGATRNVLFARQDRIPEQQPPESDLGRVDGLSGGDSTCSGSGANGVAGWARSDSVRVTTMMDAVTPRASRIPAPLPLLTPIVTSLRRAPRLRRHGSVDASTGLRGQANRLCLQALSDEARQLLPRVRGRRSLAGGSPRA